MTERSAPPTRSGSTRSPPAPPARSGCSSYRPPRCARGPERSRRGVQQRHLYADDELPGQLYDRVGVDGTYAVLVDAELVVPRALVHGVPVLRGAAVLRGRGGAGPAGRLLRARLRVDAGRPSSTTPTRSRRTRGRSSAGSSAGSAWLLALILGGGVAAQRRRRQAAEDAQVADALRPSLQEEVVELSETVGGAAAGAGRRRPATSSTTAPARSWTWSRRPGTGWTRRRRGDGGAGWTRPTRSRTSYAGSRTRATSWSPSTRCARAAGAASSTAPCFFDPRHGPSVAERPFTPEFGLERQVPVCARCARPGRRRPEARGRGPSP